MIRANGGRAVRSLRCSGADSHPQHGAVRRDVIQAGGEGQRMYVPQWLARLFHRRHSDGAAAGLAGSTSVGAAAMQQQPA